MKGSDHVVVSIRRHQFDTTIHMGRCAKAQEFRSLRDEDDWKGLSACNSYDRAMNSTRYTRSAVWSGREDLNLRHPAPKAGALPGCATPRRLVTFAFFVRPHHGLQTIYTRMFQLVSRQCLTWTMCRHHTAQSFPAASDRRMSAMDRKALAR